MFVKGKPALVAGKRRRSSAIRWTRLRRSTRSAARRGARFRVELVGHTDADGAAGSRTSRSAGVAPNGSRERWRRRGLAHVTLTAAASAAQRRHVRSKTEADKQRNRRVTVRVRHRGADRR